MWLVCACREQAHAQRSTGGGGQGEDLVGALTVTPTGGKVQGPKLSCTHTLTQVSFVEFTRNYQLVLKTHREALNSIVAGAWERCLLGPWFAACAATPALHCRLQSGRRCCTPQSSFSP